MPIPIQQPARVLTRCKEEPADVGGWEWSQEFLDRLFCKAQPPVDVTKAKFSFTFVAGSFKPTITIIDNRGVELAKLNLSDDVDYGDTTSVLLDMHIDTDDATSLDFKFLPSVKAPAQSAAALLTQVTKLLRS